MKRFQQLHLNALLFLFLGASVLAMPKTFAANNPKANDAAVVVSGNARFTVLTPEMVRIEYSDQGVFEDRGTFTIVNRYFDEVPAFNVTEDDDFLYITTDCLVLKYRKGSNPKTVPASPDNLSISLDNNGLTAFWYPGKPDPMNLKGTCRTLDGQNGDNKRSELEDGLISRSGWAVIDDSWTNARPDGSRSFAMEYNEELKYDWWADRQDPYALDLYFLGYGDNYKKALKDFTRVAGNIPLPPDYVFGYWYSRYASYSSDDYIQIMQDLEDNDIPTDVMILDMDWHWNGDEASMSGGKGGWTGWSWNTNLIPEPEKLLAEIHNRNFKISLNLHPAEGINNHESPAYYDAMNTLLNNKYDITESYGKRIPWMIDYPDFANAFFTGVIRDHEREGVDFWWLDWQQWLTSQYTQGLGETFWCNHTFFNDMAVNRPDRRPVIFHRWGGLGSHRYQIGFSGDALINFPTLAFQPYFTATASNVGYGYWGHDLGGHAYTDAETVNDPELVLRWIQFGVFTPIFRSHATKSDEIERRIWKFGNFALMRDAVNLRYALFPYIYTMAREAYETGISICRPLYYEHPQSEEAYAYEGEYYFGNDILVAPVTEGSANGTSYKKIWFPAGKWWNVSANQLIEGPCTLTLPFGQADIPYFIKQGALVPMNPPTVRNVPERPDHLIISIVSGADGEARLYEDQGDNADYETEFAVTTLRQTSNATQGEYVIEPREGNADGLVAARSYTLRIYNTGKPVEVKINGLAVDADSYSYNSAAKCTTVEVPETDCATRLVVNVEYNNDDAANSMTECPAAVWYDTANKSLRCEFGSVQPEVRLSVYNMAGNEYVNETYCNVTALSHNLSALVHNIYVYKVTTPQFCFVDKFIN